jgi:predicted acyl esterase
VRFPLLVLLFGTLASATQITVVKEFHVPVRMRDGVHLYAHVYRPAEPSRVPAILVRTPYGKGSDINPHYLAFVTRGYAVVVEDVRAATNRKAFSTHCSRKAMTATTVSSGWRASHGPTEKSA